MIIQTVTVGVHLCFFSNTDIYDVVSRKLVSEHFTQVFPLLWFAQGSILFCSVCLGPRGAVRSFMYYQLLQH